MVDFRALVEEIAAMEGSSDEKVAALASVSSDLGFKDHLKTALTSATTEKTASTVKEVAGSSVRYSKMTVEDVIGHLSDQFGRPEPKEAAAPKTPREKLASYVKAELAKK